MSGVGGPYNFSEFGISLWDLGLRLVNSTSCSRYPPLYHTQFTRSWQQTHFSLVQIMEILGKLLVESCILHHHLDIREPMQGCNYHGFRSVISWTIYCLISYIEWGHYHQSLLSWLRLWRNMSYHPKPDHHHFIILTSSYWCSWSPSSSLRGQDQAPPKPATTTKTKTSVKRI